MDIASATEKLDPYLSSKSGFELYVIEISAANPVAVLTVVPPIICPVARLDKKNLPPSPSAKFSVALAISNVGSGITYTNALQSEPIPTNLGLGVGYKINLDEYNSVAFMLDLNKLLIPTPIPSIEPFLTDGFDNDGNGVADFREGSIFGNIISSFNDAPGGFREELREWSTSLGVEYWYDNQFAVRAGYFREHPLKGDRNFLTIGVGLKYNIYGFDISYLAPTNIQRGPLDNTLRFSFTFDLGALGNDANNF